MTNINMCCNADTEGIIHVKSFEAREFCLIPNEEKVIF